MLKTPGKPAIVGVLASLGLLALTASPLFAETTTSGPAAGTTVTHEQMHQMMDAMMGEGFSQRMHAAMPGSEEMMEQCVSMMGMMSMMQGMMGGGAMSGMMGGQNGQSMQEMMRGMMAR